MTSIAKRLVWGMMLVSAPIGAHAQSASHPVISKFGGISPMPDAANKPAPGETLRAIFNITKPATEPSLPNPSLEKVARFINLTGSVGHQPQASDLIAIVHGPATPIVMSDASYRARFGVPNPNLPLIEALLEQGVQIHVCGQALAGSKISKDDLSNGVVTDLSAMTTLVKYQAKGWALIPD